MIDPFECSKSDEFFVTIGQKNEHSFIMLGVIKDGKPKLILRVGKIIDFNSNHSNIKSIAQALFSHVSSRLADERVSRSEKHTDEINYQAYSLSYEQVKNFLALVAGIEIEQLKDPEIVAAISDAYGEEGCNNKAMKAYIPIENPGSEKIRFELRFLSDYHSIHANRPI